MRSLATCLAVATLAGCGGSHAGTTAAPHGLVTGLALGGKQVCPTPTADGTLVCHSGPLRHALVVVTGPDGEQRVHADGRGRFRVSLPPGHYALRAAGAPVRVRLAAGAVTRVVLPAPHPAAGG
jgi:hypothetical protein